MDFNIAVIPGDGIGPEIVGGAEGAGKDRRSIRTYLSL